MGAAAKNTLFRYLYRDASNYKQGARVVLAGPCSAADRELIAARLDDGQWFIPSQVGLRDLQHDWESPLYEDDHVWHELSPDEDIEATDEAASGELSWAQLVARFAAVADWDLEAAQERLGL